MSPSNAKILEWRPGERTRVRSLLAMRRFWSTSLYARLRGEYDAALAGGPAPADADAARPVVDGLPALRRWAWLDRHVQDRLWLAVGEMVDERSEALSAWLRPRPGDRGTLELAPEIDYPDYYAGTDFHRQRGGIWRDDRGAAIYAMGARVIHVGRNDDFALHRAFAAELDDARPARILDLGCGFGKTTFSLKGRFPDAEVTGVDLAAPCLRLGRRLATEMGLDIRWRQGDVERLPDADDTYDLVTVTMTLHELPLDAIDRCLEEACRVLAPGGRLVALENPLVGEPLRDLLTEYHSAIIGEPFHFAFRRADLPGRARAAGFARAGDRDWSPFGDRPGLARDPRSWLTPWRLTEATKA